ncbi:MAG: hypothetical protein ACI9QD_000068 [Thermoproteota archaeon]|jgi:hypothetical protein
MKNLLAAFLVMLSFQSFGQDGVNDVSGDNSSPIILDSDTIVFGIVGRVHTVYGSMDALHTYMKSKNIQTYRDTFGLKGALVYDHELAGYGVNPGNDSGRNAGLQIVPFEIELTSTGFYISASAVGFVNMNAAHEDTEMSDFEESGAFGIINNVRIVNLIWDQRNNDIQDFEYRVGEVDIRLGLYDNEGTWIALNAGGSLGGSETTFSSNQSIVSEFDDSGNVRNNVTTDGFLAEGRVGLEVNINLQNDFRVNLKSAFTFGRKGDKNDMTINYYNLNNFVELSKGFHINSQPARIGILYKNNMLRSAILSNGNTNGDSVNIAPLMYQPKHEVGIRFNF